MPTTSVLSPDGRGRMSAMAMEPRRPLVAGALQATGWAFAGVAGLSGASNLLMLTGPLFMLQIYDRVLASRCVQTLRGQGDVAVFSLTT